MKRKLVLFLALFFVGVGFITAQTQVRGIVVDETGEPVIGATIQIKGTSQGTVTDADGNFNLSASVGGTLVVSYVGMQTQEVPVSANPRIVLLSDTELLEEIIVVGYGTQLKRDVTSSISKVSGSTISDKATPSFVQQLAGRAAGVQVTQSSGDLGTPPNIVIRGVNTISSGSQPLVVINGVPSTSGNIGGSYTNNNPLADINPADIESIEILKDGAATAIYGSRASNGVILVTTKKGSAQKAKVSYDAWLAASSASKLYDLLNARQFVEIANEKYKNIGSSNQPAVMDAENTDTKWSDHVFRTGFQHSHNISVSGGTDETLYYISAGYSDQKGIVVNNSFNRYTFNASVDQKLFKWLKTGFSLNGSYQNNTGPIKGTNSLSDNMYASTRMLPNVKVYDDTHPTGFNIDVLSPKSLGRGANTIPIELTVPNIMWVLKTNVQKNESYRLMPNVFFELNPVKGLTLRTLMGADISLLNNLYAWYPESGDGSGYNGLISDSNYTRKRWTLQNIAAYRETFGDVHNLDLTAVTEWSKYQYRYVNAGARDMSSSFFLPYIISNTYNTQSSGGDFSHNGIASYLFRANYNYASTYYIGGSVRRDGLSKLPADNRWGTFYGASFAVRLSELGFWEGIKETVHDFRLRGSLAQVGNDAIGDFTYLDTFTSQLYGSQTGISYYQTGNPNLEWEKQSITDFGFDMGLFHRINLSFAYWRKVNTDIVLNAPTPPSLGIPWNVISQNVGSVENKGMEFEVSGNVVKTQNFSYDASFNFSTQYNKVTKLLDDMIYEHYIIREGESMRSLYGYVYEGVNLANGFPLYRKADGKIIQGNPNDSKYYEYNESNPGTLGAASSLTAADKVVLGNTIPKWFGGFDNNFKYKDFDLNIFFRFSGGNKVANVTRRDLMNMYFQNNGTEILDRWQNASNPGNGNVPIIMHGKGSFLNLESDGSSRWMENGDFLKLQNVSFGYSFPQDVVKRLTLSQLRVYVQGQNLATFTKYSGLDPEVYTSAMGVDWNGNPQQRSITFGVNVVF
ncbi:TonB-linked outer membrane protein, SusC/RagA family [Porphyromonadaceae bacterium NLAE-zl-C104]|uniref:SusC/RagA family TonB-linked outer membrane protein n=1 Tax=Proteiniphilum sp. TaxID=1926877 RepID=UPI000897D23B|nr:TonB-dependent receptor [Proteiniphilum sp.]MDY9917567.1 TonB-dependent receptor [Proteiniphilum sp.]SEA11034.1 TonB-linked outer membrane protein, SusC/RagA family [Porphyromonadaceae bacterium KH3R12]SFS33246.1 TonB-linked outer membrane protein, SusC/RagA family [Porphyromonadaceae bacterium NLAE-zl-C104]